MDRPPHLELRHRAHRPSAQGLRRQARRRSNCTMATWATAPVCAAIIEQVRPDEVYNLAAQSHVRISFDQPEYTADVVGLGALRLLEALRDHNSATAARRASTRPARPRCSGGSPKCRSARPRRSIRAAPTPAPRSTPTGRPSIIARPTDCSPPTASCSTTNRRGAARISSPAKSPAAPPASSSGCRTGSPSATSTRSATGASPATTSRRCG